MMQETRHKTKVSLSSLFCVPLVTLLYVKRLFGMTSDGSVTQNG